MAKKKIDPSLLATEILEGGWVELDIDYPDGKEDLSSSPEEHSVSNRAKLAETNFFKSFPDATAG